jgi:hypothetical protein
MNTVVRHVFELSVQSFYYIARLFSHCDFLEWIGGIEAPPFDYIWNDEWDSMMKTYAIYLASAIYDEVNEDSWEAVEYCYKEVAPSQFSEIGEEPAYPMQVQGCARCLPSFNGDPDPPNFEDCGEPLKLPQVETLSNFQPKTPFPLAPAQRHLTISQEVFLEEIAVRIWDKTREKWDIHFLPMRCSIRDYLKINAPHEAYKDASVFFIVESRQFLPAFDAIFVASLIPSLKFEKSYKISLIPDDGILEHCMGSYLLMDGTDSMVPVIVVPVFNSPVYASELDMWVFSTIAGIFVPARVSFHNVYGYGYAQALAWERLQGNWRKLKKEVRKDFFEPAYQALTRIVSNMFSKICPTPFSYVAMIELEAVETIDDGSLFSYEIYKRDRSSTTIDTKLLEKHVHKQLELRGMWLQMLSKYIKDHYSEDNIAIKAALQDDRSLRLLERMRYEASLI